MASKRRNSEIIKPLSLSDRDGGIGEDSNGLAMSSDHGVGYRPQHRRSNSWCLGEFADDIVDNLDGESSPLADQLARQPWHEIGNGPHPTGATSDVDVMVDQLSSILGDRLRDLLVHWEGGNLKHESQRYSHSNSRRKSIDLNPMEYLRHDNRTESYVLTSSISNSVQEYVRSIGEMYNQVGFHCFEHATHVTISMNKLLSIIISNSNAPENVAPAVGDTEINSKQRHMKRGVSMRATATEKFHRDHHHGGETTDFTFGIASDPRILFAVVFSALIHDVGHTGVPNSVLVDEEDELAILHNDVSVAEQNSLQVAFSLLQRDEFAELKRCICPTPEQRKFFRKRVISMVMVTDISDQERVQIVASRWNAAFPLETEMKGEKLDDNSTSAKGSANNPEHALKAQNDKSNTSGFGNDSNHSNSNKSNSNGSINSNGDDKGSGNANMRPDRRRARRRSSGLKEIQSPELRGSLTRRRFTMFSTDAAAEEFANERRSRHLGIRTSMDFSGMLLDAYHTMDQLQQHAVLETMMNVADVAHTMQSFAIFCKWNRKLYKEFYVAHLEGRLSFDPEENWYENQIGFFSHYIIPLSKKMQTCGVFGTTGDVFQYFAEENKKRWIAEGELISVVMMCEVKEEVEKEQLGMAHENEFERDESSLNQQRSYNDDYIDVHHVPLR